MDGGRKKSSNFNSLKITKSHNIFEEELVTPYFRRSLCFKSSPECMMKESNINEYLTKKGIHLIENTEVRNEIFSESKFSSPISSKKTCSFEESFRKMSLSGFSLENNTLFRKRRKTNNKLSY